MVKIISRLKLIGKFFIVLFILFSFFLIVTGIKNYSVLSNSKVIEFENNSLITFRPKLEFGRLFDSQIIYYIIDLSKEDFDEVKSKNKENKIKNMSIDLLDKDGFLIDKINLYSTTSSYDNHWDWNYGDIDTDTDRVSFYKSNYSYLDVKEYRSIHKVHLNIIQEDN